MFCPGCEDLLNRNGEKYTLSMLKVRNLDFPLRSILRSAPNSLIVDDPKSSTSIYSAKGVSGIDVEQLEYFALSVFWRAALEGWPRHQPTRLNRYREELRQYLLSTSPRQIGRNLALFLLVHSDDIQIRNMLFPQSTRRDGEWIHEFRIPGLTCQLHIGHGVPARPGISEACFIQTRNIIITPDAPSFNHMMGRLLSKSKIAKGLKQPTLSDRTTL